MVPVSFYPAKKTAVYQNLLKWMSGQKKWNFTNGDLCSLKIPDKKNYQAEKFHIKNILMKNLYSLKILDKKWWFIKIYQAEKFHIKNILMKNL